jgi:hypothetical protein
VRKLFLSLFLVGLLSPLGRAQGESSPESAPEAATPEVTSGGKTLHDGIAQISALQAMLEFYFMEAGVYPGELSELAAVFNYQLPKNARAVVIPKDPATGEPFVYLPAPNKRAYKLRFPDPAKYGPEGSLELGPVSWGWLALRAERSRFEQMAKLSKHHIEGLAQACEMYEKDNNRVYPKDLDALYPKYIKRHPQDPITGRNYIYKVVADGYTIANPNPERYGLKTFLYSSSQGMVVEALPPGAPK